MLTSMDVMRGGQLLVQALGNLLTAFTGGTAAVVGGFGPGFGVGMGGGLGAQQPNAYFKIVETLTSFIQ